MTEDEIEPLMILYAALRDFRLLDKLMPEIEPLDRVKNAVVLGALTDIESMESVKSFTGERWQEIQDSYSDAYHDALEGYTSE